VNTLVAPFEALQVAKVQIAKAKAPIVVIVRQLDQPRCNFFILCVELLLVAVTRLADPRGKACHPIQMTRSLTALIAISLRRDGLTNLLLEPPIRSRLELLLKIHLLEPPVFFFKLFHAGDR
jgi:hypothetical protein